MKKFLVLLLAVVVLFTTAMPKQEAHADALALSALAGASYAIASSNGLNWIFSGMSASQTGTYMEEKLNSYASSKGSSVLEYFGENAVIKIATGLAVTSYAYNKICDFFEDLITEKNITAGNTVTIDNMYNGYPTGEYRASVSWDGKTVDNLRMVQEDGYQELYYDFTDSSGTTSVSFTNAWNAGFYGFKVYLYNNMLYCSVYYWTQYSADGQKYERYSEVQQMGGSNVTTVQTASVTLTGDYDPPIATGNERWEGTVANAPDTNLDQLLEDIFDQSAAGTLDVSGQVVDTPAEPVPTPAPTAAPGTIDDVIGQLGEMTGTLEGVQEGVGEAVGQLEGINEGVGSIAEALETPTSSEASSYKFDLTTLFPFCIPFDIYRFVTMFSASPVAPHVQIPFNIPAVGLQYTFDLDFSSFNSVASVLRSVELIAFCVGLAILTSKVIRW